MKRVLYFAAVLAVSAVLYCGFGVFCGAVYMAFKESPAPASFESSPALDNFLGDASARSADFSAREIQDGAAYIMIKNAKQNAGRGGAAVIPSLFTVEPREEGLAVCVPVSLNSAAGEFRSGVYLRFRLGGAPRLAGASVGGAKMPMWAARILAKAVFAHYKDYLGDCPQKLQSMKIERAGGKFRLTKAK